MIQIHTILRTVFFGFIVKPLVTIVLGLNVRRWTQLPQQGPAIIVANHNSHLDTLVLMSLFPLAALKYIHPVAAADYFMRNRFLAWFATHIIGIVPIDRKGGQENPLAGAFKALNENKILILFPEGSRGEPDSALCEFKQGIRVIARKFPDVPVVPIFLHGLGKSLPKGEALFVPFFCDVFVGSPISYQSEQKDFMETLHISMDRLATEGQFPQWF